MRSIYWMRREIRIHDNTALSHALVESNEVYPIFILDKKILNGERSFNGRNYFLKKSLEEIQQYLTILEGDFFEVLKTFIQKYDIQAIYLNKDYSPLAHKNEEKLKDLGVEIKSYKDNVIFDTEITREGQPYIVYTPYKNKFLSLLTPVEIKNYSVKKEYLEKIQTVSSVDLHTYINDEGKEVVENSPFLPGEAAGQIALTKFINNGINRYNLDRDFPNIEGTSRISAHLHFGTVSIRECFRTALRIKDKGGTTWVNELIWREFYFSILRNYPYVTKRSFQPKYESLAWSENADHFKAWCEGRTGYPIVDAAMKCLNKTGWMHNRLRMITASFLIKDLHIDWRIGEKYFMTKLIDMEIASNNGGWQWVASTGTDSSPYFRIFSPIEQSKKFDQDNEFIKKWIPEFGTPTYPNPIIDHYTERLTALKMYNINK